jgi:hypothetical protein
LEKVEHELGLLPVVVCLGDHRDAPGCDQNDRLCVSVRGCKDDARALADDGQWGGNVPANVNFHAVAHRQSSSTPAASLKALPVVQRRCPEDDASHHVRPIVCLPGGDRKFR